MLNIVEKSQCSGCYSCSQGCPQNCITMTADEEGFWYPLVDKERCIECGVCVKNCPIITPAKSIRQESNAKAYAAFNKDENIRLNSSSGGVFSAIAKYVLANNGVVFGATFDEDMNVKHEGITSIEELDKLRGSKYVQSKIGNTYEEARKYLQEGRMVLFTGTPCQIGGIYSYLGREYSNLITQDIICHGVPSPMILKKYIEFRESIAGAKTEKISFRHKKYGWKDFSMLFEFNGGKKYLQPLFKDIYLRSFLKNLSLRPSCYSCAFKSKQRKSDFTLADFWGIDNVIQGMNDNKGISLLILNSIAAHDVFDKIKDDLVSLEVDFDKAISFNSAMTRSVEPNSNRREFFDSVRRKGIGEIKKYVRDPLMVRLKIVIKKFKIYWRA